MAWKIDRDHITEKDEQGYAVGRGQGDLEGDTFRFRLRDDDGEVYYGGVFDRAAVEHPDEDKEGSLVQAWQWGMYFAGAVDLQVRGKDGVALGLTSADRTDREWVSAYA